MSPFHSIEALHAACTALPLPDRRAVSQIQAREAVLTKPAGSLGRLEELVEWFGAWRPLQVDQVDLCILPAITAFLPECLFMARQCDRCHGR